MSYFPLHTHTRLWLGRSFFLKINKNILRQNLRTISIIFDEEAKWTCDDIFRSKAILFKSNKILNWIIVFCLCQLEMMIEIFFLGKFLKKINVSRRSWCRIFFVVFMEKSQQRSRKTNRPTIDIWRNQQNNIRELSNGSLKSTYIAMLVADILHLLFSSFNFSRQNCLSNVIFFLFELNVQSSMETPWIQMEIVSFQVGLM